jgi:hypothetical protein
MGEDPVLLSYVVPSHFLKVGVNVIKEKCHPGHMKPIRIGLQVRLWRETAYIVHADFSLFYYARAMRTPPSGGSKIIYVSY